MVTKRCMRIYATVFIVAVCTISNGVAQNVTEMEVNGIKVLVSPADNDIVSVIIGLEGGVATGETDNPALGEFTSDLITSSGSRAYPKDEFRKFLSITSTSIFGGGDYGGISYNMTSTRQHFDKAWDVLQSVILEPEFDNLEYKNILQRRIAQAQQRWTRPDDYADIISDSLLTQLHPVLSRTVYEKDVQAITIPMLRAYHKKLSERSRMIVVVVGKVSPDEIKAKLASFTSLPKGNYSKPNIPKISQPSKPRIEVVDRANSPTSYIYARFAGPEIMDPDYWPLVVGASYLRNILFKEIRTKRNLSYAPGAFVTSSIGKGFGGLSVSTVYPDSSIKIMYEELTRVKNGDIDAEELNDSKQVFITRYYMREMSNSSKVGSLFYAYRNTGSWKYAFSYNEINAVDKASVQRAFKKYANNLQVGIVGRADDVTKSVFLYK